MYEQAVNFIRNIVFAEPDKLDLISLVPALFFSVVIFWLFRRLTRPKETYGSRYPLFGTFKFWTSLVLLLLLAILALAIPFIPSGNLVIRRGNAEIIFLVDYSSSMFLKDTGWARIDIAVREIMDLFTTKTIVKGDRVALFVFGSGGSRRVPLTTDLSLFSDELSMVGRPNTLIGDSIYWTSDMAGALVYTISMIDRQDMIAELGKEVEGWQPKPKQNRLVFVFTDGGDILALSGNEETDKANSAKLSVAIKELNRRNLKVYPIGIGTRRGASMTDILLDYKPGEQYDPKLAEELKGKFSRLNVRGLEYLKNSIGSEGPFLAEDDGRRAGNFMAAVIDKYRSSTVESAISNEREDLWPYFLILAMFIFIVGLGWYLGLLASLVLLVFIFF